MQVQCWEGGTDEVAGELSLKGQADVCRCARTEGNWPVLLGCGSADHNCSYISIC